MIFGLIVVLVLTLILPLLFKKVEQNLEVFLFLMGLSAAAISGVLSGEFIVHVFENKFLYMIVGAVFIAGIVFKVFNKIIMNLVQLLIDKISLRLFVFLIIIILGLMSSIITAIISSLLLIEIINLLPISRKDKISVTIIACFSIGLGATLTPLGEPLATVVVSKLNIGFWFILQQFGVLIILGVLVLGVVGAFFANKENSHKDVVRKNENETYRTIVIRTIKVFIFIVALELLGGGYRAVIDTYIIGLDSHLLYWTNTISAVLDNATLATAEISAKMSLIQVKSVLMGLLISGGMMIPGNIPNIISADKLKIKSSEWIKLGVPVGLAMLVVYYFVLF